MPCAVGDGDEKHDDEDEMLLIAAINLTRVVVVIAQSTYVPPEPVDLLPPLPLPSAGTAVFVG